MRWQSDGCDGGHTARRAGDVDCHHPVALERDRKVREAMERGDDLVQSLAIVKYALSIGETGRAMAALDQALVLARSALSELVTAAGPAHAPTFAGTLVRSHPTGEEPAHAS